MTSTQEQRFPKPLVGRSSRLGGAENQDIVCGDDLCAHTSSHTRAPYGGGNVMLSRGKWYARISLGSTRKRATLGLPWCASRDAAIARARLMAAVVAGLRGSAHERGVRRHLRTLAAAVDVTGDAHDICEEIRSAPLLRAATAAANRGQPQALVVAPVDHPDGAIPSPMEWPMTSGVYFVEAAGYVKIGKASCVRSRLTVMQPNLPFLLSLLAVAPGSWKQEREYHAKFRTSRVRGEWYALSDDIKAEIYRLRRV